MNPIEPTEHRPVSRQQGSLKSVKGLMLCRIIILSLLLAIAFLFQLSEKKSFFIPLTNHFYYFIGLFYFVTIVYAFLLKRVNDLRQFLFVQMIIDHFFIIGLVYFTGGWESFYPITYIFTIIACSILFYKWGAFFSASLATFLYSLLLVLQYHGWVHTPGEISNDMDPSQVFYSLILYMATFFIVAFLSSTISEELKRKKRELIQKQDDYDQLETFNRNIIQSLDSGLLTTDLQGRINFLNRTAEKILGVEERALKIVSIYELFPNIGEMIQNLRRQEPLSSYDYQRCETTFTHPEGQRLYLGFSISPLTGPDGSLMGYTLIFQDISKFKEMEEQMIRFDKMAAIGQLAAGMAHEIRNPLTSLTGSIQMLKSELLPDSSNERLMNIILRESERLNSLITDFLLFATPPKTNKTPVRIGKVIDETIDLFRNSLESQDGIRIIQAPVPEDVVIRVDPDQIRQVLWNLLINAAQAMPNGGEVRIALEKKKDGYLSSGSLRPTRSKSTAGWKISLSDSGCGIPLEEREKIFEPFYTTKDGGTGLGLSIVHKIIENHKGVIRVESDVGKGSTFSIFLPAAEDEETVEW